MPVHPLVYAYDLPGHMEIIAHIADLKPYQYQDDIDVTSSSPRRHANCSKCCGMPCDSKIAT